MAYSGKDPIENRENRQRGNSASGDSRHERALDRRSEPEKGNDVGNLDEPLYFFPDEQVTESRVRWILNQGTSEEKAWVISHLLRYAQWSDIWKYVSREEVREIFPLLQMPDKLRTAWGRMLKVEAPVG